MIRQLGRALALTVLVFVGPVSAAAGVAYLLLDDSAWTNPPAEATDRPRPAAAPKPPQTVRPTAADADACFTRELASVDCKQEGALAVVGVTKHTRGEPCSKHPETDLVWHTGTDTLCLAAPR